MSTLAMSLPSMEECKSLACRTEVQVTLALAAGTGLTVAVARKLWAKEKSRQKRERKRKARDDAIKKLEEKLKNGKLSPSKQREIVNLPLSELIEKLQTDQLNATEALEAYQIEAIKAHKQTNCLVDVIWEAEDLAAELDQCTEKKGILHGVPVSIKDNVGIKGYDSTIGCAKCIDDPVTDDAVILKLLMKQGAIPYVKTNVPQTMMSIDSSNPIFGQTTNPFDSTRTAGGSSGGEGALIGAGGSPLGIGSDIGGSIRVPSHFCGICGFKPTWARISLMGTQSVTRGQNLIRGAYGPMARDVDSLVTAMRVLLVPDMFKMDSACPPIPWRNELYECKKKLRIGYYTQDGYIESTPATQRAVMVAKEALEKQGHELVPIKIDHIARQADAYYARTTAADGGITLSVAMKDDAIDPVMKPLMMLCSIPKLVRMALLGTIGPFFPKMAFLLNNMYPMKSVYEWFQNVGGLETLRHDVVKEWRGLGLDAVVAPVYTAEAVKVGVPAKSPGALGYALMYNALNFPAGSLPVTKVTQEDQLKMKDYPASEPYLKAIKNSSSSGTVGLPVSVQVVTYPWEEELCLRAMKELEEGLISIKSRNIASY